VGPRWRSPQPQLVDRDFYPQQKIPQRVYDPTEPPNVFLDKNVSSASSVCGIGIPLGKKKSVEFWRNSATSGKVSSLHQVAAKFGPGLYGNSSKPKFSDLCSNTDSELLSSFLPFFLYSLLLSSFLLSFFLSFFLFLRYYTITGFSLSSFL
jgi:hypothetical protein